MFAAASHAAALRGRLQVQAKVEAQVQAQAQARTGLGVDASGGMIYILAGVVLTIVDAAIAAAEEAAVVEFRGFVAEQLGLKIRHEQATMRHLVEALGQFQQGLQRVMSRAAACNVHQRPEGRRGAEQTLHDLCAEVIHEQPDHAGIAINANQMRDEAFNPEVLREQIATAMGPETGLGGEIPEPREAAWAAAKGFIRSVVRSKFGFEAVMVKTSQELASNTCNSLHLSAIAGHLIPAIILVHKLYKVYEHYQALQSLQGALDELKVDYISERLRGRAQDMRYLACELLSSLGNEVVPYLLRLLDAHPEARKITGQPSLGDAWSAGDGSPTDITQSPWYSGFVLLHEQLSGAMAADVPGAFDARHRGSIGFCNYFVTFKDDFDQADYVIPEQITRIYRKTPVQPPHAFVAGPYLAHVRAPQTELHGDHGKDQGEAPSMETLQIERERHATPITGFVQIAGENTERTKHTHPLEGQGLEGFGKVLSMILCGLLGEDPTPDLDRAGTHASHPILSHGHFGDGLYLPILYGRTNTEQIELLQERERTPDHGGDLFADLMNYMHRWGYWGDLDDSARNGRPWLKQANTNDPVFQDHAVVPVNFLDESDDGRVLPSDRKIHVARGWERHGDSAYVLFRRDLGAPVVDFLPKDEMRRERPPQVQRHYHNVGRVHWQVGLRESLKTDFVYLKNWHIPRIEDLKGRFESQGKGIIEALRAEPLSMIAAARIGDWASVMVMLVACHDAAIQQPDHGGQRVVHSEFVDEVDGRDDMTLLTLSAAAAGPDGRAVMHAIRSGFQVSQGHGGLGGVPTHDEHGAHRLHGAPAANEDDGDDTSGAS